MNTYLFAWNPNKWTWTTLDECIEQIEISGKATEKWSCVSHRAIKPGDRAFIVRLGSEPRGVFGAGYVSSEAFLSKHWNGGSKNIHRVLIDFEVLLNPEKDKILTLDYLKTTNLKNQQWSTQSSGISIKPELTDELEATWFSFLTKQNIGINTSLTTFTAKKRIYTEGIANQILQTRYERNPFARAACLKYYGYSCSVCEFNFEKKFGELGKGFIHVHHLTQISNIRESYLVDPVKDLRPVCPNCHAMLHKQNPPLTIDELKKRLVSSK